MRCVPLVARRRLEGALYKQRIWIDLNTYVVSKWGQNSQSTEEELFCQFAEEKLGLTGFDADVFRQLNLLSIEAVRKGQCNSYAFNDKWWSRDECFSFRHNKKVIASMLEKVAACDMAFSICLLAKGTLT